MPKRKLPHTPICPYCGRSAVLVLDDEVYTRSYGGHVWLCRPCEAWVGTHRNSPRHIPLGRLAKADLRRMKVVAHAGFDDLWKAAMKHRGWAKGYARLAAYRWLAKEMDMPIKQCHIGMMDEAQTQRVIDIVHNVLARRKHAQQENTTEAIREGDEEVGRSEGPQQTA